MHPVKSLQELLAGRGVRKVGKVIGVTAHALSVSTERGVVSVARTDITNYNVGDEVILRDGMLKGKVLSEKDVPVFVL